MNATALNSVSTTLIPNREMPYRLVSVSERYTEEGRTELILDLDGATLSFRADVDNDTLDFRFDAEAIQPHAEHLDLFNTVLDGFHGQTHGWHWIAGNSHTVHLGFAGITQGIMILVLGAGVKIFSIDSANT